MDKKENKKEDLAFFGAELKKMRVRAGLTQSDLAKKTGIKSRNFWQWEKGLTEPSGLLLFKILKAVDVIK